MNAAQSAAFVTAQAACATIEAMAMKAENESRSDRGFAQAYGEEAFLALIDKYGIGHNATVAFLNAAEV